MYPIQNLSNQFYYYDMNNQTSYYIGDKSAFLRHLASVVTFRLQKQTSSWIFREDKNINVTGKDKTVITNFDYFKGEDGHFHLYIKSVESYLKSTLYYDGNYRTIDVRNYKNEVIQYIYATNGCHYSSNFYNRHRLQHRRKRFHSGTHAHNKCRRCKRVLKFSSIPEYKIFVKGKDKQLPYGYEAYETFRRVSCSWKDQSKSRKQWGKHHNIRNHDSIKYKHEHFDFQMDDENFDQDLLLSEAFEGITYDQEIE